MSIFIQCLLVSSKVRPSDCLLVCPSDCLAEWVFHQTSLRRTLSNGPLSNSIGKPNWGTYLEKWG